MTDLPRPVRLYTVSTAPNPRRVLAAMALKGIALPLTELDMVVKREQYDEAYLAKTGRPVIPALELESGEFLTETIAITRYLEHFHPDPPLFGRNALEAARIEMWQRRAEFEVLIPVAMVFRHGHPGMVGLEDQVPAWAEANLPRVEKGFAMLENRLRESPFLAGDSLTVADITAYMSVDFAKVSRIRPSEDKTALAEWAAKLKAMPGFAMKKPG